MPSTARAVGELGLPVLDYADPELRGERFHRVMRELAAQGWLAAAPFGYVVLDREAAAFFLRTRSATFPGRRLAELFGIEEGPLAEEMRRNILHLDGEAHRRLRSLVNPAFTPRAADRWRPAMRRYLAELFEPLARAGRCELVSALAKPYPSLIIATVMGAPLGERPGSTRGRTPSSGSSIPTACFMRAWRSSVRSRSSTSMRKACSPSAARRPGRT